MLTKRVKIKMRLTFISILMLALNVITGCSMSYTSKELSQNKTENSWSVDFKYLDGDLAHSFKRESGEPSRLIVNSIVESGSLILKVQLSDKIEEISVGKKEVDLSSWGNGDFILRIVGDNAQNGSADFIWK